MRIRTAVIGFCVAAAAITSAVVAGPGAASGGASGGADASIKAVGLADGGTSLVSFAVGFPQRAKSIGAVSGLVGDTHLVGIDVRPATGKLYGVGNNGGVYLVDAATATAAFVAPLTNAAGGAPITLSGTSFAVDFNPTVDRLRIVSDAGQNLRANVANGVTNVDLALTASGVTGAGYTNNDADPSTNTTLFDLSTNALTDQVVVQSPANNGTLVATGNLGLDATDSGFDIWSNLDDSGRTVDNRAYAVLTVGGVSGLYRVSLLDGRVTQIGDSFKGAVSDLAMLPDTV